jgi:hypothetical protein
MDYILKEFVDHGLHFFLLFLILSTDCWKLFFEFLANRVDLFLVRLAANDLAEIGDGGLI